MDGALNRSPPSEDNLEATSLVWLDASVNTLQESIDAQHQLRLVTKHLETFERDDDCEEYIKSLSDLDRTVLIVSGSLGQKIIPRIHQYRQIVSIYVYCGDRQKNEWTKQFRKVQGIAVQLGELISLVRSDKVKQQENRDNEAVPFAIYTTNSQKEQLTSELNGQFVHLQLLINYLIQIKSTSADTNELMSLCEQQCQNDKDELIRIHEFNDEYSANRAVRWYTRDSFVYRILNKALRVQDIHVIFLFRFLIRDLGKQLKDHQYTSRLTVYRGQLMWSEELESLKQSKGQLISINSFLSTSLNRQLAYEFLFKPAPLERVLFEIDADPQLHGIKPFANISSLSYYKKEEEVLFMLGSIFRLVNISHDRNGVWTIKLTLCGDQDSDVKKMLDNMQSQNKREGPDLVVLGDILRRMGKFNEAKEYYQRCLEGLHSDDKQNLSICYYALGRVADCKGDYERSLQWLNKSLEIDMQIMKPDDPRIANTHNAIANVYQSTHDYTRAFKSYDEALVIFRQTLGEGDPHVAMCLNNIGAIYQQKNNYSEALAYYQDALTIREKHLSRNHSDIGASHNNIGTIYRRLGQSNQALENFNLALKIYEVALPPQHPDIAMTLENIGIVYEEKSKWKEALSYYKKADAIYQQALPSTHLNVVQIKKSVDRLSSKLS